MINGPDYHLGRVSLMRLAGRAEVIEPGKPLTARGIEVMQFGHGDRIDLRSWTGKARCTFRLRDRGLNTDAHQAAGVIRNQAVTGS